MSDQCHSPLIKLFKRTLEQYLFLVQINLYHILTYSPTLLLSHSPSTPPPPPTGVGLPDEKETGVCWQLCKELLRGTKNLFCGCTNSKTTCYVLSYFFQLNTLKGTTKAPAVHLLRLNTFRDTETAFFTPKRFDELPDLFIWESYPGLDPSLLSPNKKCILFPYGFFPKHLSVLYLIQTVCRTKHISFVISTNCLKDMESDKKGQLTPTATLPEK